MEYRYLGRSGLKVSEICMGAMSFGEDADEPTSRAMLDRFFEVGGNFVDTADVYGNGASEEIIGRWLTTRDRDELVIATKVRWRTGDGVNSAGLSRKHILRSVDASLRRLGTEFLDLYQVHGWDPATPIDETLSTLDSLVSSGKVRYLGVLPWSPLRGGWLSGKYQRGMTQAPKGTRVDMAEAHGWKEAFANYDNERTWSIIDELSAVAKNVGHTPAQVALRWVSQQRGVVAPIIGARNLIQLNDNLGAVGWALDTDDLDRLTKVGAQEYPYPYPFVADVERLR